MPGPQDQDIPTDGSSERIPSSVPGSESERIYDVDRLPHDPGKRMPISSYDVNDQDAVRRGFVAKGPCQTYAHAFPTKILSVKTKGGDAFVKAGFRNWRRYDALDKHMRSIKGVHRKAQEKFNLFLNPNASIVTSVVKQTKDEKRQYKARLTYSIQCIRLILRQGLASRGHDESEESLNKGNFLELLAWLAENNKEVWKVVLKNAPKNCQMTAHEIQSDIINCFAKATTNYIIEDIGADYYSILADESSDVSHKEQLALCLRYVDKEGRVCERFLGVVHVADTASLSLKKAIESLLMDHSLSLSQIRGQGYDGASNMKGEINGLKALIMTESPCAYYIHCFAHQLQLVLVAVAKGNADCGWFFDQVSILLSVIGVSCKRHEMIRGIRTQEILEALELGDIESGKGLNQEMGLSRPGDTRWGSHYKTVLHIVSMYSTILKVLIKLGKDRSHKDDWGKIHAVCEAIESFDFIFIAHLMLVILGYTDDLCQSLQRKEQDIVNAMSLVQVAKGRLQHMRDAGWEEFLQEKVTSFCMKHRIKVPDPNRKYRPFGRDKRFYFKQTNDDHFRREVYLGVIDTIHQELDNRFDKVNMQLLLCISAFNPINSFASYDKEQLMKLATFYPKEFSSTDLTRLSFQLDNFIDDMRLDGRFNDLKSLGELSVKLVETKKRLNYKMVYLLLKLVLLLPVATASVERVFSAMTFVKNKLRNRLDDQLLNDCLVTFIERDMFLKVTVLDVMKRFQNMADRLVKLNL
ncbi:hypothetical protein ACP70R_045903 [Stipagrostis hirtigluma subsp. patula]